MRDYLLLLHENPAQFADVSPAEMQAIIERYSAWSRELAEAGRLVSGTKLTDEGGRHLRRNGTSVAVTDGPYAETREVIGGQFVIRAEGYDEACTLAKGCPHLDNGWIEVREVEPTP